MYNNFAAWTAEATRRGCSIEPDGSGNRLTAHIDGSEIGTWDNTYAGCGGGWFNQ